MNAINIINILNWFCEVLIQNQCDIQGAIIYLLKTIAYFLRKILISFSLILVACSSSSEFELIGEQKVYSLNDFEGKWLVINFYAQWCAPCHEEIPELNQLSAQGESLNLSVIGISYDQKTNQELSELAQSWNIKFPLMASEPIPILPFSLPATLPTNYLINPEGEIVKRLVGKQTLESLLAAIDSAKKGN